jgi:hypothetical protein
LLAESHKTSEYQTSGDSHCGFSLEVLELDDAEGDRTYS